jgi:hypothetical protein
MTSRNIYEDRLETFTFQEMLDGLVGIGVETGRLELKRERVATHKLAYIACSMANAGGGMIAIGLNEPGKDGGLRVEGVVDISDGSNLGLLAGINARVYPPLPLDIHGYENVDRSASILVLRVARSTMAPHEYTGTDEKHNLPVRRGTMTDHLRLAEIDALRTSRAIGPADSPLGQKQFSQISLQHEGVNPDFIFGMIIEPTFYHATRRIMDVDDDRLCAKIAALTKGDDSSLHGDLELGTLIDGVWLHSAEKTQQDAIQGRIPRPDQQIEIESDGTIRVRFLQHNGNLFDQFFAVLAVGYIFAQEIFYAFGIAPEAQVYVIHRLSASAREAKIAQNYEDGFTIDLATQQFADAFLATTMRMLRATNQNSERDIVRNEMLQSFVNKFIPCADEFHGRWLC